MKLSNAIGYDFKSSGNTFVIGTHDAKGNKVQASQYTQADVDQLLATLGASGDVKGDHQLLAAQIVEPIMQVVPYLEMWSSTFFMDQTFGDTEDNSIPVEDLPVIAFDSTLDGTIMYTRAGYSFTRPDFRTWDAGVEVSWASLKKAGWNYLARQMNYVAWELARKRDQAAKAVLTASIPSSAQYTVTGGKLTKTSLDTVLKAKAQIGYPVRRVLINSGTIMDMASFTWPTGLYLPDQEARDIIKNLYIGNYGGADFFINAFAPTDYVYFGGTPDQIGYHQVKGAMSAASDVDISKKVDLHAFYDAEHSWYVGNTWSLASLQITA
jgi:hypothetical protein